MQSKLMRPVFFFVLAAALAVVGLTLTQRYPFAFGTGIGVGAILFLYGMARGGGLGNARQFERGPADVSARVGTCLAAAGIASGAIGHDPPFPLSFRVFYGVCLAVAAIGAAVLAGRAAFPPGGTRS